MRIRRVVLSVVVWSLASPAFAACPSRTQTYTAGQVINPSHVTENENNLFEYLCGGVDTYDAGSVTSTAILDGTIAAVDLSASAIASASIVDGTIVNADVNASAAIDFSKLATLTSGNLLVGSAGNVVTSVNPSGDVDVSAAGAFTIQANSVALGTDTTGNYAGSSSEGGAATTATALAANGSNCSAGNYPLGVDASGAVESCTAAATAHVADRVHRTAGNVTTTSGTLVAFTGASITLTTGANPLLVGFTGTCSHSDSGGTIFLNVDIDGSLVLGTSGIAVAQAVTAENQNCSFVAMTADVTAASHTIELQWSTDASTATMLCGTGTPCNFWVAEVTD